MKNQNKEYFSRGSRVYTPEPRRKVEESPVSAGFEQKDYKNIEDVVDKEKQLMLTVGLSVIAFICSMSLTVIRLFNQGEIKIVALTAIVSFMLVVSSISQYVKEV